MKLKSLSALILAALATVANAAPQPTSKLSQADLAGYYSSSHPSTSAKASLAVGVPATDITIVNVSNNVIHVGVVGTSIDDVTYPNKFDHIKHPTLTVPTTLNLSDAYNVSFTPFGLPACRLAVVVVTGIVGSYQELVDSTYCSRP